MKENVGDRKRTRERETSESVKRDFKANILVLAQDLCWCRKCRLLRTSFTIIHRGKGIRAGVRSENRLAQMSIHTRAPADMKRTH